MKTKFKLSLLALLFSVATIYHFYPTTSSTQSMFPAPTNGTQVNRDADEGEDNQEKRAQWLEMMHSAAPDVDWRAIEYKNKMERHRRRVTAGSTVGSRGGDEVIGNYLVGEWKERGSRNQAGSVIATNYDPQEDNIYLISDGGTFWRGARDGSKWEVVNQDLQFQEGFLENVETDNGRRWLAITGGKPHYSDDEGESWTSSSGIFFVNSGGSSRQGVVLNDADRTFFLLVKPSGQGNIRIFKSTNQGKNFIAMQTFEGSSYNNYRLCNPAGTNDLYLAEKISTTTTRFYKYEESTGKMEVIINNGSFGFGSGRANLTGVQINDTLRFVAYNRDSLVFVSDNEGIDWKLKGKMGDYPWGVGIYISPSNPNFMLMGAVECYKSLDGGVSWYKINNWWDYYDEVDTKLHADMMFFKEFETAGGDPFVLISNHGGMNVTYDEATTTPNIGLLGLNVSQYYDVRTDPLDPFYVYAGTQDQGFQRGFALSNNALMSMDQVISGDYGHIVFSQNNRRLWTVYPWGTVNYYPNPQTGYRAATWTVESSQESVWIPPMIAGPDPTLNEIYVAGGNADGGPGSHIIRLTADGNNDIQAENLPFDFRSEADGEVSALGISQLDKDYWYAATTNGRFFYSTDRGQNWEQSLESLPGGQYLYGSTILPSKKDKNTVYFGGSGYSNPAVYISTDNGFSFIPMTDGLPPTLVIELTSNTDETMLFAATEAGPYVYIVEKGKWYDMSGMGAPAQTYWSVEYLDASEIVRFGTYGRGIFDFQIKEITAVQNTLVEEGRFKAYPNPTEGLVNIELQAEGLNNARLQLFDLSGKLMQDVPWSVNPTGISTTQVDISAYPAGTYIVRLTDDTQTASLKVVRK